jgi:protease I
MKAISKHIAILVHNYFEQSELEVPMDVLVDNGLDVTVISASGTIELTAMHGPDKAGPFRADALLEQTAPSDFRGLILPGGVYNADKLRMIEPAQHWVKEFFDKGKMVAAICHAPWLLISADLVEGRRLTGYYTLRDDIVNAGGEWADFPLIVDDNLITSRHADDLPRFCEAVVGKIEATMALAAQGSHKAKV